MNAKEALSRLKNGNEDYVNDRIKVIADSERRDELVAGQSPYAIVLSCADSRVIPEAIFNVGAGEIFDVRVAGNIANSSSIASIEYAVAHLGTKLIVVLGHQNCGAVTAAVLGGDHGYNLNHLLSHITPAVHQCDSSDINDVVKVNADLNAKELANRSSIIREALSNGLEIVSAYYNLEGGKVEFL